MSKNLTFGSDPEFFILNTKEEIVPLPFFFDSGIVPVEVDPLFKHPFLTKQSNFKIIMDGAAAEFTLPPVKDAKTFYNNISDGLNWLEEFADKFNCHVGKIPAGNYIYNNWDHTKDPLWHQCGIFGCDKDADAIDPTYDSPDIDVSTHKYRYAGGHFHISDDNTLIKDYPEVMIKLMAIYCGNISIKNSPYPELEKLRAWKYGQPARYRVQKYSPTNIGVEYRSPSNVWTTKLDFVEEMFEGATKAYEAFENPEKAINLFSKYLVKTVENIKNVNQEEAKKLLEELYA